MWSGKSTTIYLSIRIRCNNCICTPWTHGNEFACQFVLRFTVQHGRLHATREIS